MRTLQPSHAPVLPLAALLVLVAAAGCGRADRAPPRAAVPEPAAAGAAALDEDVAPDDLDDLDDLEGDLAAEPAPPLAPVLPAVATTALPSGLTAAERARFYHQPLGTEALALPFLRALQSPVTGRSFLEGLDRFGLLPDPDSGSDALPIGLAIRPAGPGQPLSLVGATCSACHVAELRRGDRAVRIDGAPGAFDARGFHAEALAAVRTTLASPAATLAFSQRFRAAAGVTALGELNAAVLAATCPGCDPAAIDRRARAGVAWLAARPPRPEYQSAMARSAQGRARQAASDQLFRDRLFALEAYLVYLEDLVDEPAPPPGACPLRATRTRTRADGAPATPRAVADLDALMARITPPAWPAAIFGAIDRARAERGRALFAAHCARCHARELHGVWSSPPYLASGTVPTLRHLLLPARARPPVFFLGAREYDPALVGLADVPGPDGRQRDATAADRAPTPHEHGTTLAEADQADLLEYLKTR